MSLIPVIAAPQVLVFDTGPLWELVLYSAVHTLRFESLRSGLNHLRADASYQRLTQFVASFQTKTTTPHVIAEISSKIVRTEQKGRLAIWGIVYTEFSSMRMDEGVIKLLEMPQNLVADIGAADASVLKLGLSFGPRKSLIVSTDGPLIAECKRAGVYARDLWEVIAS